VSTAPEHTPIGARLRERTQPLAPDDETYGYAHAHLCEAIGRMLAQLGQVVDPDGDVPPYAPIFDVDLCPDWALGWLAQLVGVRLPQGIAPDDARTIVREVAGYSRGTPAAMRAGASLFLTGDKTMYFRERDTSAYQLEVVTLTSETPDPARVQAALLAQKPGGIVLRYRVTASWDWQQAIAEQATWASAKATYSTWRKFVERTPG
jgi:hypothetical protein